MIRVWNVKNVDGKSDVKVIRECCRKSYQNTRNLFKVYDDGRGVYGSWDDCYHLGGVEDLLFSLCELLVHEVTYKGDLVLLEGCLDGFRCGDGRLGVSVLISSVCDGSAFDSYFWDYKGDYLGAGGGLFWCVEFIIGFFKRVVNVVCGVIGRNDVGRIF